MKININNKFYKVEVKKFINDGIFNNIKNFILGETITGQINISENKELRKILLRNNLSKKDKIDVLYHEISHGILLELEKLDKIDSANEKQTNYLKRILLKIFKVKCQ